MSTLKMQPISSAVSVRLGDPEADHRSDAGGVCGYIWERVDPADEKDGESCRRTSSLLSSLISSWNFRRRGDRDGERNDPPVGEVADVVAWAPRGDEGVPSLW